MSAHVCPVLEALRARDFSWCFVCSRVVYHAELAQRRPWPGLGLELGDCTCGNTISFRPYAARLEPAPPERTATPCPRTKS